MFLNGKHNHIQNPKERKDFNTFIKHAFDINYDDTTQIRTRAALAMLLSIIDQTLSHIDRNKAQQAHGHMKLIQHIKHTQHTKHIQRCQCWSALMIFIEIAAHFWR